jgi:hypothetical protein
MVGLLMVIEVGMDKERRSPISTLAVAAIVLLCLPALYVLSSGPASWLVGCGLLSGELAEWIYAPLLYAMDTWPAFGDWLIWYWQLLEE